MQLPNLINWDLILSPYNWVAVVLMTMFALMFLHLVMPEESPE